MNNKQVIIITGPTAVGKTEIAIDFAESLNLEIVSCDSRQFYKEMTIGTAKPTDEQLFRVKHHFINTLSVQEDFSAGEFERQGLNLLEHYFKTHNKIIVSGGSGLYIKALCEGFNDFPEIDQEIIDALSSEPLGDLQIKLKEKDPSYYLQVDLQNKRRLIRALSVIETTGKPYSASIQADASERSFLCQYLVLNRERELLYNRINKRVDSMMEEGLLDEVEGLLPFRHYKALQTVGYQEFFPYFDGKRSLEEAIDLVKRNTRRYAKRQLTWFRKIKGAIWLHPEEAADFLAKKM